MDSKIFYYKRMRQILQRFNRFGCYVCVGYYLYNLQQFEISTVLRFLYCESKKHENCIFKNRNTLLFPHFRWAFITPFVPERSNYCILVSIELLELLDQNTAQKRKTNRYFIYRRPTLYPLEIAVDFLKSL